jgi:hypothetical protein
MTSEKNKYSLYCSVCSGCGEEGCCSPLMCKQSPDGHYCEFYLKNLKFGYVMYENLMKILEGDEKYKEQIDELWDDTHNYIYKK